jgi:uncharacterized C2H2 Zn-finger protein
MPLLRHFRYCPKHKKPLPCPHCTITLVDVPAATVAVPVPGTSAPELAPIPVTAKKPGAPRKHVDNAAKQRAYRDRLKNEELAAERVKLIKNLTNIYDQKQDRITNEYVRSNDRVLDRRKTAAAQRQTYIDGLTQMSLDDLKNLALVEPQSDFHGKKEKEHQTEDGDIASVSDWMQTREHVMTRMTRPATVERWLDDAIEDLLTSHDSSRCPVCDLVFPSTTADWSRSDMAEHLWKMFREGEKKYDLWKRRREAILDHNTANPQRGLPIPEQGTEIVHFKFLWDEIEKSRKRRRKNRRANIVTATVDGANQLAQQ